MALTPGTRVGPYDVTAPLGAGGMGEVYRARDSRLHREVALKVLPAEFAGSPDRRQRFEREARAAAALNHPNILTLFDIGEEAGIAYLVTELIEGVSLRERLQRSGRMPVKDSLRIAVQIADGLAAAHQARITHRDIKPENIMITGDGRVKILDFGLAQYKTPAPVSPEEKTAVAAAVTSPGAVLGTANYMSPEQARGDVSDHRSDQFSFGQVLYELLMGKPPFVRETPVQTMSAILTDEPPPLDASTPLPLRWTVARCLEKDPGQRYESTRDLLFDLRNQQTHLSEASGSVSATAVSKSVTGRRFGWVPAVLLGAPALVFLLVLAALWGAVNVNPLSRYRLTPMEVTLKSPYAPKWSPDGKAFTYNAEVAGTRQVFLRYLDQPTPARLTRLPENAFAVGWSGDSKRVFFLSRNPQGKEPPWGLFSVAVTGGHPEFHLAFAGNIFLAPDGSAMATFQRTPDGIWAMYHASPIGAPLQRYTPAPFETRDQFDARIMFSPDGRRVVIIRDIKGERQAWSVPYPPSQVSPKQILHGKLPVRGGTPNGDLFPNSNYALLSASSTNTIEYSLSTIDLSTGDSRHLTAGLSLTSGGSLSLSLDGRRILFAKSEYDYQILSMRLESGSVEQVISSSRFTSGPSWARQEEKFVYDTFRNGESEIWIRGRDGSDRPVVQPKDFAAGTKFFRMPSLSPDGQRVSYVRVNYEQLSEVCISAVSGGLPVRLTNLEKANEDGGSWSPDGASITYIADYGSKAEQRRSLWLAKTTGEATPVELRRNISGTVPEWSPDGKWIKFFDRTEGWTLLSPDGKQTQSLGSLDAVQTTFSKDSAKLYGLRSEKGKLFLFVLNLASKKRSDIAEINYEFIPRSPFAGGGRLSLSPDGKSILYPAMQHRSSLWMLEGFPQPSAWGRAMDLVFR